MRSPFPLFFFSFSAVEGGGTAVLKTTSTPGGEHRFDSRHWPGTLHSESSAIPERESSNVSSVLVTSASLYIRWGCGVFRVPHKLKLGPEHGNIVEGTLWMDASMLKKTLNVWSQQDSAPIRCGCRPPAHYRAIWGRVTVYSAVSCQGHYG